VVSDGNLEFALAYHSVSDQTLAMDTKSHDIITPGSLELEILRISRAAQEYDQGSRISVRRFADPLLSIFPGVEEGHSRLSSRGLQNALIPSGVSGVPDIARDVHHGCGRVVRLDKDRCGMAPQLSESFIESLPVPEWWNQVIWRSKEWGDLTRRTLVLCLAGRSGLVDPKSNQSYAAFRSLGWTGYEEQSLMDERRWEFDPGVDLVYLREIAHEVLCSPLLEQVGVELSSEWYRSPSSAAQAVLYGKIRASLEG
jgi:hypothetical protein